MEMLERYWNLEIERLISGPIELIKNTHTINSMN